MGRTILAVDDDAAIRKVVTLLLEREGFTVRNAENGDDALAILSEHTFTPDCILLDIRMPGKSGTETLADLRKNHPLVPVIMLTASTAIETGIKTMKNGAFDYLVKPVRKLELVETVKKALHFRDILLENERLEKENLEYQKSLEKKVEERTKELFEAYGKLKKTNLETVLVLAETIEAKDPYTRGHCNRVRILSKEMAKMAGMDNDQIESLEYGALLHDIGKIGISELLLGKKGGLDDGERKIFNQHPLIGENIVKTVEFFNPCLPIVRNHHEWFNGSGYPDKKKGASISPMARIVSIADAFDAMTSDRPYRNSLPLETALLNLEESRETQFDPDLVDLFIEKKIYTRTVEGEPGGS